MFSFLKIGLLSVALGAGAFLTGCAANGPGDGSHAMATSDPSGPQAAMCSQCKVVLVRSPVQNQKGRVVGYATIAKDMCPDCRDSVQNFFATGHLEHGCKACGGEMKECVPK